MHDKTAEKDRQKSQTNESVMDTIKEFTEEEISLKDLLQKIDKVLNTRASETPPNSPARKRSRFAKSASDEITPQEYKILINNIIYNN